MQIFLRVLLSPDCDTTNQTPEECCVFVVFRTAASQLLVHKNKTRAQDPSVKLLFSQCGQTVV